LSCRKATNRALVQIKYFAPHQAQQLVLPIKLIPLPTRATVQQAGSRASDSHRRSALSDVPFESTQSGMDELGVVAT
jgi:hypothetical protein